MSADIIGYLAPGLVAVLTAAAGVIEVQFRDVDAYARRRGVWQWLLVALAAVATMAATNSAAGDGSVLQSALLGTFAAGAVILAHILWRRLVPDAEPRNRSIATAAAAAAVIVVAASVSFSYVSTMGCRQVKPLVQLSRATTGAIMPVTLPGSQGPTVADFDNWAKAVQEEAAQVSAGEVAAHAKRIGELAGEIAESERAHDKNRHAGLSVEYYDELTAITTKCRWR